MICNHCGKEIENPAEKCPHCGSKIAVMEENKTVICEKCGEVYDSTLGKCPLCGTAPVITAAEKTPVPKKKNKLWLYIGGSVLVIAALIFCFVSGVFKSNAERFIDYERETIIEPIKSLAMMMEEKEIENADISMDFDLKGLSLNTFGAALYEDYAEELLNQLSLDMRTEINAENAETHLQLGLMLADTELLQMQLLSDQEKISVYLPSYDEKIYTISRDKLVSEYDLTINEGMSAEKLNALIDRYAELFFTLPNKDNLTVEKEEIELPISENVLKAKVYTLKPTAEELSHFLASLGEMMKGDEDLKALLGYDIGESLSASFDEEAERMISESDNIARDLAESFEIEMIVHDGKVAAQSLSFADDLGNMRTYYMESYYDLTKFGIFGFGWKNEDDLETELFANYQVGDGEIVGDLYYGFALDGNAEYTLDADFVIDISEVEWDDIKNMDFRNCPVTMQMDFNAGEFFSYTFDITTEADDGLYTTKLSVSDINISEMISIEEITLKVESRYDTEDKLEMPALEEQELDNSTFANIINSVGNISLF